MAATELVSVENITSFQLPQGAEQSLSFIVKQGECLVLMGANGTGKTTTLHLLAGLIRPRTGIIYINGINITKDPLSAKRYIGFLPHQLPLYTELTVIEYLRFVAKLRQIPSINRKEAIEIALETVNLHAYQSHVIGTLSRGLQQRVGIAQAILHQPPVLLLDEPTEGLDFKQLEAFQSLLQAYKKKGAVILSTHHLSEVRSIYNEVLYFTMEGITSYDFYHCPA